MHFIDEFSSMKDQKIISSKSTSSFSYYKYINIWSLIITYKYHVYTTRCQIVKWFAIKCKIASVANWNQDNILFWCKPAWDFLMSCQDRELPMTLLDISLISLNHLDTPLSNFHFNFCLKYITMVSFIVNN